MKNKKETIKKELDSCEYYANALSSCIRRKVGAIAITKGLVPRMQSTGDVVNVEEDRRIIGTNHTAKCLDSTEKVGCKRQQGNVKSGEGHEQCRGIHAEQNVIITTMKYKLSLEGATMYCTHKPCFMCVKMLLHCGIKKLYYREDYPDTVADSLIAEAKKNGHDIFCKETEVEM